MINAIIGSYAQGRNDSVFQTLEVAPMDRKIYTMYLKKEGASGFCK